MEASNPLSIDGYTRPSELLKEQGLGIRGLFRVSILVVVAIASIVLVALSFTNVTNVEHAKAEASMRSEANYLCLQLESLGERADAFGRITNSAGAGLQELETRNPEEFDLLSESNDACMFVTMWVGVLDYEKGFVEYVNAGHNPPLLWQAEGDWHWLEKRSGLPLGLIGGSSYDAFSFNCGAGDKVLLYTDDVTEAMSVDDELYGEERLEAVANAATDEQPESLVKEVRRNVASFAHGAEQSDDITILALEIDLR